MQFEIYVLIPMVLVLSGAFFVHLYPGVALRAREWMTTGTLSTPRVGPGRLGLDSGSTGTGPFATDV